MPPHGLTSILGVTDKQYGDIQNFWGKIEKAKPEMPQQLELFLVLALPLLQYNPYFCWEWKKDIIFTSFE